jgi:hypothetical protein
MRFPTNKNHPANQHVFLHLYAEFGRVSPNEWGRAQQKLAQPMPRSHLILLGCFASSHGSRNASEPSSRTDLAFDVELTFDESVGLLAPVNA